MCKAELEFGGGYGGCGGYPTERGLVKQLNSGIECCGLPKTVYNRAGIGVGEGRGGRVR